MKNLFIDLQRFAAYDNVHTTTQYQDLTGTTKTEYTAGNGLSEGMVTFYSKDLIRLAEPELVYRQFAEKKKIPANNGKTIQFRRFGTIEKNTTALKEGVTPAGTKLSQSAITATVKQYGDYIALDDMVSMTHIDPIVVEANRAMASQAARSLDALTRDVVCASGTVHFPSKVANNAVTAVTARKDLAADSKISVKILKDAYAELRRNNAPKFDGFYICIMHPDVTRDLMDDEEWKKPHQYQDTKNIYSNEVGQIAGFRIIESSEAKIIGPDSTGAAAPATLGVYCCACFGKGAYATTDLTDGGLKTILKPLGAGEDPLDQRSTVGWKATNADVVLVPEYITRIECVSSYSGNITAGN